MNENRELLLILYTGCKAVFSRNENVTKDLITRDPLVLTT